MSKLIFNSYAKLNLHLEVLNKRRDNYHNIKTLFERIDLCDRIVIKSRPDSKIKITCSDPAVPKSSSNLCYRSAELLRRKYGIKEGVQINITKRIPVGAGLGGGSSNAAGVLLGLNRLWKLGLSRKKLLELAAKIGCDLPFFIYEAPFALGTGRGDKITPLKRLRDLRLWHLLVVPRFKASTPLIYKKWDEFRRAKTLCKSCGWVLTTPGFNVKIRRLRIGEKSAFSAGGVLFNGLQQVAARIYPEIESIKEELVSLGLKTILMSGSGPAVFGIVSSRKGALTLRKKLKNSLKSCRVYVTGTF